MIKFEVRGMVTKALYVSTRPDVIFTVHFLVKSNIWNLEVIAVFITYV